MNVACLFFETPSPTIKIAELFMGHSPQIAIRTDQAIFIEIGKCKNLYSADNFIDQAQLILHQFRYKARISTGEDVTDTLALARYKMLKVDSLPLEALLDFADPFHRDEAVRKGVFKMVDAFGDLGVKNLGQFKKLPVSDLISRFGQLGRFCHMRTRGSDFINWPLFTPEEVITEITEFPYFEFYGELTPILFALQAHVDRAIARLAARERRATKIQVQVHCEKISTHPNFLRSFDIEFHTPQSLPKGMHNIIKERLTKEFEKNPIHSPIEAIQLTILKSVSHQDGQKNFFNKDEEKFEQLHSIHNQLVEMLGQENIYQAELTEDRRPEKSWKKKLGSPHEPSVTASTLHDELPARPTYLCKTLIKIEITAGFVHIKQKRYRILNWDPQVEKITGGWFEEALPELKNTFDRNYYCVVIQGNQKIFVFETPEKKFFLQGYYG